MISVLAISGQWIFNRFCSPYPSSEDYVSTFVGTRMTEYCSGDVAGASQVWHDLQVLTGQSDRHLGMTITEALKGEDVHRFLWRLQLANGGSRLDYVIARVVSPETGEEGDSLWAIARMSGTTMLDAASSPGGPSNGVEVQSLLTINGVNDGEPMILLRANVRNPNGGAWTSYSLLRIDASTLKVFEVWSDDVAMGSYGCFDTFRPYFGSFPFSKRGCIDCYHLSGCPPGRHDEMGPVHRSRKHFDWVQDTKRFKEAGARGT